MNKPNYDAVFIKQTQGADGRERLLLHCCCAPCSSACLERLKGKFAITALFYNPNIEDGEYPKRKAELIKLIEATGAADILDCDYTPEEFYAAVKGLENEREGGARCAACFKLRLERTAALAAAGGYDYFSTTLTLSPLKDAQLINRIGEGLQRGKTKWLYADFKKRDGYLRSIELSAQYGLYRQNFCGCEFSRRQKA